MIVNTEPFKFLTYLAALVEYKVPMGVLVAGEFYDFYRRESVGRSTQENAERQLACS